jgi:Ca2+-transporting ATPase
MAFVVLAASQLFYSLSMRNFTKSIFKIGIFSNMMLIGSIIVGILLQLIVITVPALANAFGVHNLSLTEWGIAIGFALIPLIVNEIIKVFTKSKEQ